MKKNSPDFSMENAKKLASSPDGQELIKTLRQSDASAMREAARQIQSGNYQEAQQALGAVLNDPKVQALLRKLGGSE